MGLVQRNLERLAHVRRARGVVRLLEERLQRVDSGLVVVPGHHRERGERLGHQSIGRHHADVGPTALGCPQLPPLATTTLLPA
jgi:hypothetical protein